MTERKCHDCGANPGELHQRWCDTERCPLCGGQALQCFHAHNCPNCHEAWISTECDRDETVITNDMLLPWTGEWPGVMECREFGWYSYFGPPWIRCEKDHPDAHEDLRRLHEGEAEWSRDLKRYVLRSPA